MAVPGFSVTDLIQALGQVKIVYDAFFSEYTNSASQVRDLADDIDQFRKNLKKHQEIVEARGLEYSGYEAVQRTLGQCTKFLEEYKDVLDKRRRKSVSGAIKTAKFAFEQQEIDRLRGKISRHESNILQYSVNIVLEHSFRNGNENPSGSTSTPIPIQMGAPSSLSPPKAELLGSQSFPRDRSSSVIPELSCEEQTDPRCELPEQPKNGRARIPELLGSPVIHRNRSRSIRQDSYVDGNAQPSYELPGSPTNMNTPSVTIRSPVGDSSRATTDNRSISIPQSPRSSTVIPPLVLPQAALLYRVAEVYFATKKVDLKRKPTGRDCEGGREMLILDQDGNLRFRHRIKIPRNELCYPYTWHRRWQNDHDALEVSFKGSTPEAHSVSFKGMTPINAIPKYIFTTPQDFLDFQGEVRGKHLEDTFDIRQIDSAASSKNGEATDQHLKIWRDYISQEGTLSFYASAAPKPQHIEFPIAMFEQEASLKSTNIRLNFMITEMKRARTFSKAFGRSPTEKTSSTVMTTTPRIFSRTNTGATSSASSTTTAPSRMSSIASFESDNSQSTRRQSKPQLSIETQAKQMRYLKIEFSDELEAQRFKKVFDGLYQEEVSRPLDFFQNWQMNASAAGTQRPESVISSSPNGTPFAISPKLYSRNQNFYDAG